jgi:hypothetical protein
MKPKRLADGGDLELDKAVGLCAACEPVDLTTVEFQP